MSTNTPRKFWCLGLPKEEPDRAAQELRRLGIEELTLGSKSPEVQVAAAAGLRVHVYGAAFSVEGLDDSCLPVGIDGKQHRWFGNSGCPNHPAVRQAHLERVAAAARQPQVQGYFLDGIRFASPNAGGEAFFTCFCDYCERKAQEWGLDWQHIRTDVGKLSASLANGEALRIWQGLGTSPADVLAGLLLIPGIAQWLHFRQQCIAEHVQEVRDALKRLAPYKLLGAYVFAPAFAPLVGQSYHRLGPLLDCIQPMLYRLGSSGDSTFMGEITSLAGLWKGANDDPLHESSACTTALALYGIDPGEVRATLGALRQPYPPAAIGWETQRARSRLGPQVHLAPIIWLQDSDIAQTVRNVQLAGAEGFSLFAFQEMADLAYVQDAVQAWE